MSLEPVYYNGPMGSWGSLWGGKTQKLVSTVIKEEWLVGIYGGWLLTSWQELSGGEAELQPLVKASMVTLIMVVTGHSDR